MESIYLPIILIVVLLILLGLIHLMHKVNKRSYLLAKGLDVLISDLHELKQQESEIAESISLHFNILRQPKEQVSVSESPPHRVTLLDKLKSAFAKVKVRILEVFGIDSLERFIGLLVSDKIGITALISGIVLFMSYTPSQSFVNGIGRLVIGVAVSLLLLWTARLVNNKHKTFSSVLTGGAIATVYFSVSFAFEQQSLFSNGVMLLLLFFITVFTITLSIIYDRREIAALAFTAAFIAPFIAPFNFQNHILVFVYVILINLGILVYNYFKKSLYVNTLTYISNTIYYAFWIVKYYKYSSDISHFGAFLFLTVFYLLTVLILLLHNIRKKKKFIPIEFTAFIYGALIYYSGGLFIIERTHLEMHGLFTGFIALLNLTFFVILSQFKNIDRNISWFFLGLSILFLTLVPPVQFAGTSITFAWAIESVFLLWIGLKSGMRNMKLVSIWLNLGVVVSLSMDFYESFIHSADAIRENAKILISKEFVAGMLATMSFIFSAVMLRSSKDDFFGFRFLKLKTYSSILMAFGGIFFYLSFLLQIRENLIQSGFINQTLYIRIGLYNFIFLMLPVIPALFKKVKLPPLVPAAVSLFTIIIYVLYYHPLITELRDNALLIQGSLKSGFSVHYYMSGILLGMIAISYNAFRHGSKIIHQHIAFWVAIVLSLYIISSELDHWIVINTYREGIFIKEILSHSHHFLYNLLWGIIALILCVVGFLTRQKQVRSASLTLMIITLVKFFVLDVSVISQSSIIVLLVTLGVVFLIIAFLYNKESHLTK